jgi:hypothetical protein
MPWVRIEEKALTHPKILHLSDGAFRLWVAGLAHCQQHLTDGMIAAAMLRTLVAMTGKRVKELLDAGLWTVADAGFMVHDYLQHNESRAVVLAKREAAKERMRSRRTSPERSHEQSSELRPKFACGVSSCEDSQEPQVREGGPGETIEQRAGRFAQWYGEAHERHVGVGYLGVYRDYESSLRLCEKFTDAELRDAALVWFGQDDDFATRGTRTIAKFASRASDCVLQARKIAQRFTA